MKKINKKKLRFSIASDLEKAANCTKSILPLVSNEFYNAANQVRNNIVDDTWGYSFSELELPIKISRHIKPDCIKVLHMYVDINVKAKLDKFDECTDGDPFDELNFRVRIVGDSAKTNEKLECGFHIDRINDKDDSSEMHPLYHVHYFNESQHNLTKFVAINMDSPRLMHHPVEAILGVLLAVANFNPELYAELKTTPVYPSLCKKYSDRIIRPYIESLFKSIGGENNSSVVARPEICPYIN